MAHNAAGKMTLLPAGTTLYVQRRASELAGVSLAVIAVALSLILLSFSVDDPSANNATGVLAQNLLGLPGAYVADFVLQTVGTAGGIVSLVLMSWGWRILTHRGLPWFWLNLAAVPVALTLAAIALAAVPTPQTWPLPSGLGGWLGDTLFRALVGLSQSQGIVLLPIYYLGLLAPLALITLTVALGLDRREWRGLGAGAVGATTRTWRFGWALGHAGEFLEQRWARLRGRKETAPAPVLERAGGGIVRTEPTLGGAAPHRTDNADAAKINMDAAPVSVRAATKRVAKAAKKLRSGKRAAAEQQPTLDLGVAGMGGMDGSDHYSLPALSLLAQPKGKSHAETVSEDALEQNARLLESVLQDFGVHGDITKVRPGPVVTLYELEPAPGTKTSRVIGLSDDIARSMSARSVRVSVVPGRNAIGIEMPNTEQETVFLRELLGSAAYESAAAPLTLALGKDIGGAPVMADLARMPHLLIAGTTGSGKSVGVNSMILSLLYRLSPDQCRMILIDPKMLELGLQRHSPSADAGGDRAGQGRGRPEVGGARDGKPLPRPVATGRAQYIGLQPAPDRSRRARRGHQAHGADRLRCRKRRADLRGPGA